MEVVIHLQLPINMRNRIFIAGSLIFALAGLSSCSEFSKDGKVSEVITDKLQNTEKEFKALEEKLSNSKNDISKLNDLARDVDKMVFDPKSIDFSPIVNAIRTKAYFPKRNLDYKFEGPFYKPFGDVIQKNGITISYQSSVGGGFGPKPAEISDKDKTLNQVLSEFFFTNISVLPQNDYYYDDPYYDNGLVTNEDLEELKKRYNESEFTSKKEKLAGFVKITTKRLESQNIIDEAYAKEKIAYKTLLMEEFATLKKQSIDRMLIVIALPTFGIIILLLMCVPRLYNQQEHALKAIFEKGLLIQLITVFLLTVTILILGIGGKLSPEVLGTLLGGISVYVLQKTINGDK